MRLSLVKSFYVLALSSLVTVNYLLFSDPLRIQYRRFHHNRCLTGQNIAAIAVNHTTLLTLERQLRSTRNIFFLETSCRPKDNSVDLSARQACSIEAAARAHPNYKIFVLHAAPRIFGKPNQFVSALLTSYDNVNLRNIDVWSYSRGTPLEEFFDTMQFTNSKYFNVHLSDVLRFLTLWKFGGKLVDFPLSD